MPVSPAADTARQLSAGCLTVLCFAVVICRYAVVVATGVTLGPPLYNVSHVWIYLLTMHIYAIAIWSIWLDHPILVQVVKRAVAIARQIGTRRVALTLWTVAISIAALCLALVQLKPVLSSFYDQMINDNYLYVNPRHVFPPDINIETIELPANSYQHQPKELSTLYHQNEDAVFLCNFEVGVNVDFKTVQVTTKWTVNYTITINNTSSVEIRTEGYFVSGPALRNEAIGSRKYRVKSRLIVMGVNHSVRPGVLSCKATVLYTYKALGMFDPTDELDRRFKEMGRLVPMSSVFDYVVVHYVVYLPAPATKTYISPGGIMMTYINWYSLNKDEDIIVEHRVNGRLLDRDQRTVVNGMLSCWVLFTSYQTLRALLGQSLTTVILTETWHYSNWDDRFQFNKINEWHSMCVTSDMYGLNTWHVRRVSPKDASGRELVTEERSSLVHAVWLAPVYSLLLFNVKDHWYEDFIADCYKNDQQIHSDDCRSRIERLDSLVDWYRFIDTIIVCIIMYTIFVFLSLRVGIFVEYVITLTLPDVGKFSLKTLCVIPFVTVPDDHGRLRQTARFDYDVFLAYAEENGDIARAVTSVLTSFGLRVFDSQRDVPATRQTTAVWDEMMGRCSSVLVLASHTYFTDSHLRVQFRALYDCLLHQELPSQLLVLEVDRYHLPAFLGPLPFIDLRQNNWTQLFDWWLIATFFSPFQATHSSTITRTLTTRAVMYQALKDFGRDVLSCTRSLLRQNSVNCELIPRDTSSAALHLWHGSDPRNVSNHNVFLSFCEDSDRDRKLASVVKAVLQGRGLSVYDTSLDLLPGQENIQLIRSAASCRAFVVIMSSAYSSDPLTCRLHLHQVHQALGSGRVPTGNVVFIHTDDNELLDSTHTRCDEVERATRDSPSRHVTTASTCTSKALVPYRQHPHTEMCQTIINAPRRALLLGPIDQERIAENVSLASYGEAQPKNDLTNIATEDPAQLILRCDGVIPSQQSHELPPNSRTTAEASRTAPSRQGATACDDSNCFIHDNILAALEEKCFHLRWSDLDAVCQFLHSWARMVRSQAHDQT